MARSTLRRWRGRLPVDPGVGVRALRSSPLRAWRVLYSPGVRDLAGPVLYRASECASQPGWHSEFGDRVVQALRATTRRFFYSIRRHSRAVMHCYSCLVMPSC